MPAAARPGQRLPGPAHWRLSALALLLAAAPAPARILVVGDSNALGVGVTAPQAWTSRLQRARGELVQVYGAPGMAIGAPTVGLGWHTRCLFTATGLQPPRVAILALGTNDADSDPAAVRRATRATLAAVAAPWICITPPRIADRDARLEPIRAAIAAECLAAGAHLVDGTAPIGLAELGDGLHFAPRGHARLARAVAQALAAGGR